MDGEQAAERADLPGRVSPRLRLPAFGVLDWIRVGLLAAGIGCVVTGLLPAREAGENLGRIAPLLLFLAAIIVLAKLTKEAQVFDLIATRVAILGRGNYATLFLLCVAFASLVTIFLNLDTTAVLLTPVMLALAQTARIAALPLAMTTVWLANTASLLLPVSNLTNLLAADRIDLGPTAFAARMWAAQIAAIAVTMVFLWVCYWRRGRRGVSRYEPPAPVAVKDPLLLWPAAVACLGFIVAILAGVEIHWASAAAALIVVAFFAWRGRERLRLDLVPWQLLIFVTGLFLVVPTLSRHGLAEAMIALIGTEGNVAGEYRAAAAGAGLANLINNLPAYTAGEAAIPPANGDQLVALLIGTNVGSLVTPWASLATLLWFESCAIYGVRVPLRRFMLTGAALALCALALTVAVLPLTA
ncbi:SLC13 family permease [Rhizohabitans arisaemae]|uniref:SLC13 family permease n=1 Tax=Rhizohabitans arisaemae TaxID=2720610 RepID=UPI0024B1F7E6|nr:SLC13 family permease [Rhizohabitans arisaemae]